jgi:predicted dehydrogenase
MTKANKIYKAAVIGCGNIGASAGNYHKAVQPGTHAGAYLACKRTKLTALVEANYKRHEYLRKNFPKVKLFVDMEKMFSEIKPDIVSVATPSGFHLKPVELAAGHKTPAIICEKPIAYTINEAERMIEVCKKNGSLLFINHQRHFDPLLNKWKEKINKGFLGTIYQGNIYYYNGLFNNGTHWLDLLRNYLGTPV